MVSIDVFLPYIRTVADGCPDLLIQQQIQNTIADFCERSQVLKTETTADLVAGISVVSLVPDAGTQVVKILNVYVNKKPISPTSVDELDEAISDWRNQVGSVNWYIQNSHEEIQLIKTPDQDLSGGVLFRYAYRPDITAIEFPDMLFERWFEGILAGVKGRIFGISGKSWSDPSQSTYNLDIYESAIGAASAMGAKQFGRAALRVKPCP